MMQPIKVNILVPIYNEIHFIHPFLESLKNQNIFNIKSFSCTISLIDGNSSDGTLDVLHKFKKDFSYKANIEIVCNPKKFVPHGLNKVIKNSHDDLICRVDVHAHYPKNYLECLCETIVNADSKHRIANVGTSIRTLASENTLVARSIAKVCSHSFGVGSSFRSISTNKMQYVDTVPFGCWKKEIFNEVGLFDEMMLRNQDDEFNWRLGKAGYKIGLIPNISVDYFSRPNIWNHILMYYQYGLFKPLTIYKSGTIQSLRAFAPVLLVLYIFALSFMSAINIYFSLGVFILLPIYIIFSIMMVLQDKNFLKERYHFIRLSILAPILFLTHISYGLGFLKGFVNLIRLNRKLNIRSSR